MARYLTKSLFKLGLECPTKLYYSTNREYLTNKKEDSFLLSLAQGGFQVQSLAQLSFPKGILVEGNLNDYEGLVQQTSELLKRDEIVLFEAAISYGNLFVRSDIINKKNNQIELIEVKAKSYDPQNENLFIGKKGKLVSGWKSYLFDVAFQKYVISLAFPSFQIRSYLKMADKTMTSQIDGLNQIFRISKDEKNRVKVSRKVRSIDEIGSSVLSKVEITSLVDEIINGKHKSDIGLSFKECLELFEINHVKNLKINYPVSFKACKICEFKDLENKEKKDLQIGFKECWNVQKGLTKVDYERPMLFEIAGYSSSSGQKLFDEDRFFMDQISEEDLNVKVENGKISASERRWIQVDKRLNNDESIYFLSEELKGEIDSWTYPLHFIDFETSVVPLPFHKGKKPYDQIAFQFSHHKIEKNGSIHHSSQFINVDPGVFPNFDFIRSLENSLKGDNGTIFRYAAHENTILNAIWVQLHESSERDKEDLKLFIQSISHSTKNLAIRWKGERDMVDLCEIVKKYYYNPFTNGSNSIKYVLPAIIRSSQYLKDKYSKSIGELGISSLNFESSHIWLKNSGNIPSSPYSTLPPLFDNWSTDDLDSIISGIESIEDGGAALTAYGKLQYTDMKDIEREELKRGLLKYCELDTLAMVMLYEHMRYDLIHT